MNSALPKTKPVAGNQKEYAEHRKQSGLPGATPAAVSYKVKAGKLAAAFRPDGLLDFAIADREWTATTNPLPQFSSPAAAAARPAEVTARSSNIVDGESFLDARTRRERAEADQAETRNRKSKAELIERSEARKTWFAIGKMFSAARETIPAQIAPKLLGKTDLAEIEQIIRSAFREADLRVASEIQSRFAHLVASE